MSPRKKRSRPPDSLSPTTGNLKKVKSVEEENWETLELDFSSPKKLFESLISPTDFDKFFELYWEKKPLVIHRENTNQNYKNLFSLDILQKLITQHNLQFVQDVNVVRYLNSERINLNQNGKLTIAKLNQVFHKEKGTIQFHQPQRFQDKLWQILEFMESFFGCLAGSNVYITPSTAQGLPPHHDDVEVFILQLEGEKHWRLYNPIVELPREYSRDLTQDEIGLPTHNFILKPGDFLYFPRGTIHQADTPDSASHSTHITISAYQHHTWGDYLLSVFPRLIENSMKMDISFRKGLPINFLKSSKISQSDKLQSVMELLLQKLKYNHFIPPEDMIEDFMSARLPPFPLNGFKLQDTIPDGNPPDLGSKVRLKYPDHICFLCKKDVEMEDNENDEDDEESEEDNTNNNNSASSSNHKEEEEEEKEMLFLFSSVYNDRSTHMMGKDMDDPKGGFALKFPKYYISAVTQLKSNSEHFLTASELNLEDDADKEHLLRGLWSSHLLEVQLSSSRHQKVTKLD